jgi:hypothetical protein
MLEIIFVYIALVILNYIAIYMTETVRWNILETTVSYSKEEYFKKCLGKSFNQYLLDLQIKVAIPFYGLYYSISFYKRFDRHIQSGYSRQMALWLTTLEEN